MAALLDPMELKDRLGHINAHACDLCPVDSLLLVVVGSHRRSGGAHRIEAGESIPLEKARQRHSRSHASPATYTVYASVVALASALLDGPFEHPARYCSVVLHVWAIEF